MMGVVRLVHKIGDRQLQLMRPQPARFVPRCEAVVSAEVEQDVGGLSDDQFPRLQERRRKRRGARSRAAQQAHPFGRAAPPPFFLGIIRPPPPPPPTDKNPPPLFSRPKIKTRTPSRPPS